MKKYDDDSLSSMLPSIEHIAYLLTIGCNVLSGLLTGGNVSLYLLDQGASVLVTVLISVAIGLLTMGVLIVFTTAVMKVLPRLTGYYLASGIGIALLALVGIVTVSGTSNANLLAYWSTRTYTQAKVLAEGERALAAIENSAHQLGQIAPIVRNVRVLSGTLKEHQRRRGPTGAGEGPIFTELLIREARLADTEKSVAEAVQTADREVRSARKLLEDARAAQKDGRLSSERKRQLVETATARLNGHVIAIRLALPVTALNATAEMLRAPVSLSTWSTNASIRRVQEEECSRLHAEFEPIGLALQAATRALEDGLPEEGLAADPVSPFALGEIEGGQWWIAGLGYAVDCVPQLTLCLILVAHAQLRRRERRPQLHAHRVDDRRAGNGVDRDHVGNGRERHGRRRPDWRE